MDEFTKANKAMAFDDWLVHTKILMRLITTTETTTKVSTKMKMKMRERNLTRAGTSSVLPYFLQPLFHRS
jgi:hypothetical protein